MTEWIDVPVAEVAKGDSVKIKGYGRRHDTAYTFGGHDYYPVVLISGDDVMVDWMQGIPGPERNVYIVRSSLVAARRKPEPAPKPGDWRHGTPCSLAGTTMRHIALGEREDCSGAEVYRASGGWSRDTRTGEPWVMREGDPVEVVIQAFAGNVLYSARHVNATQLSERSESESFTDYYRRIGLDVRPVERRKR